MTDGGNRKDSNASDSDGRDDMEDMEKAIKDASEDSSDVVVHGIDSEAIKDAV